MAKAGWTETEGQRTSINGLEAYVGRYEGVTGNVRVTIQAAHVRAGDRIYVVAGVAPSPQFAAASGTFGTAIRSFRSLTQSEADRIQPSRIDFYTARSGDTWASIAAGAAGGHVKAATLAIMNGRDPGSPPRPGERLRIVVGD
jgi:predicted Zn-dependent protease